MRLLEIDKKNSRFLFACIFQKSVSFMARTPRFDPNPPPPLCKPHLPIRSLVLSIFLFTVGVIFLLIGLSVFWNTSLAESIPFTALGSVCFVPGVYHVYVFFKVWRGDSGHTYDMLENYD